MDPPASTAARYAFSSTANRQVTLDEWTDQGAMRNPTELPRIDGAWHWLEPADHGSAQALGYETPINVTLARANGALGHGPSTPNVVFIPNQAHLNPIRQPEGEGYWSYVTVGPGSAREFAWTQLGLQDGFGFANVPYPTPQQVWQLRQRMMREGRDTGALDGIDIAWIAIDPPLSAAPATTSDQDPAAPTAYRKVVDPELVDPKTGLEHDLTNGGDHDQTGADDLHSYRTIDIEGSRYTCDVSTALRGREEPHKMEIPNGKGTWRTYPHSDNFDWNSKQHLKGLNAWRDQVFGRGEWPKKRDEKREVYSDAQKRWVFDLVDKNGGKPPGSKALAKIAEDFNKRYGAKRTSSAISALCARLHKMHERTGGKFEPGPKRGHAKKKEAELKRKEREDSEEQTPKKRRKTSPKKEAEEEMEVQDLESGDEDAPGEEDETGFEDAEGEFDEDGDVGMSEEGGLRDGDGEADQEER